MKRFLCSLLLFSAALQAGCAKTVIVPRSPDKPETYRKAKSIFVVLKTAEICEMEDVSVAGGVLMGTRVFRNDGGMREREERVAIMLDKISTIQIAKTSSSGAALVGIGTGIVLGSAVATFVFIWALASALGHLG